MTQKRLRKYKKSRKRNDNIIEDRKSQKINRQRRKSRGR